MSGLPTKLTTVRASLLTAKTAARLKRRGTAGREQQAVFRGLVKKIAATTAGRAAGLTAEMDYERFHTRVQPRDYSEIAAELGRTWTGEADVLWPGTCALFAQSAGTTGEPKFLPVTETMLEHFRDAGTEALLHHTARMGHAGAFRGRHVRLEALSVIAPYDPAAPGLLTGDVGALLTHALPPWLAEMTARPAPGEPADWPERITELARQHIGTDMTLLSGQPEALVKFATALLDAVGGTTFASRWPNLEVVVLHGAPAAPQRDELRALFGPAMQFHEIYAAAEGVFAAQDGAPDEGLRLLTDAGIFFEFVPARALEESRLFGIGPRLLPLERVKTGEDYALFVTTPAGLRRHLVGDLVRFVSVDPPRVLLTGRVDQQLNAFGERVSEGELADALAHVCRAHGWSPSSFHVAPITVTEVTGASVGRHEWWLELKPGTIETPTGPQLGEEFDAWLRAHNANYDMRRRCGGMSAPFVRLVMPGIFEQWRRRHGRWGGQGKMPICRGDRSIADELAQVARFTAD